MRINIFCYSLHKFKKNAAKGEGFGPHASQPGDHRGINVNMDAGHDDEAALIAMRYALADVIELCGRMSTVNRADALVIEHILKAATMQVMLLLNLQPGRRVAGLQEPLFSAA
jgi:hypothetical protein